MNITQMLDNVVSKFGIQSLDENPLLVNLREFINKTA